MKDNPTLKKIFGCALCALCSALIVFVVIKFSRETTLAFWDKWGTLISVAVYVAVGILLAAAIVTACINKEIIYKSCISCFVVLAFFALVLLGVHVSDLFDKIDSVEHLREFIGSYGALSTLMYLLLQVVQIVLLPIPGIIAVGAGVLLFGPFKGALLSILGSMIGSLIAFYIGRVLGYRAVKWLVGEENLQKGLDLVKGKDKVILSFMFLFPFFPDDLLCFVAGLSTMSSKFYFFMILITRTISSFTTAYSVNGSLIPYDTWWGILIWAVLIIGSLLLVKTVYKNSDKIESFIEKKKNKKKPPAEN